MKLAEGVSLGAQLEGTGVRFAAWSDSAEAISVVLYDRPGEISREVPLTLALEPYFFTGFVSDLRAGTLYDFRIDGRLVADPYARELPFGVHGPARVVEPVSQRKFQKRHIDLNEGEIFYELHVGTFTPQGTFSSAISRLRELRELGVTVVELMPIAAFPGARGWGYDGVGLFAPFAGYGTPEELSAFIDAVHAEGMSVVLDVVYNHLGPDGNTLPLFSKSYFDSQRENPWGAAPALDKPAFRRFVLSNARHWLEGFGFDGLRLDATHELEPGGDPHILSALSEVARACLPPAVLIAEDNRNDPKHLLEHGVDAVWSDDFHHVLHVLLTHERDGYYRTFTGDLSEVAHVIERGQLFVGQAGRDGVAARGKSTAGVPPSRFLFALQNHDQVGNRAQGERLHSLSAHPTFRAASLLLLFLPATPLLFMGQEWASSTPFLYFSDHAGELGAAVSRGRAQEFAHFSGFGQAEPSAIPDPQAESSFLRSKLDWAERTLPEHDTTLELYRRGIELRRTDPVLRQASELTVGTRGGLLWVLRRGSEGERLLLFNPGEACSLPEVAGRSSSRARLLLATHPLTSNLESFELAASSTTIFALATEPSRHES